MQGTVALHQDILYGSIIHGKILSLYIRKLMNYYKKQPFIRLVKSVQGIRIIKKYFYP